jgi:hypothetical protein
MEEHRFGAFESKVLRRIFGPKREEVAGGWRRLHNELHNLYTSPYIVRAIKTRKMRWTDHVGCTGERMNAYKFLVRKTEGKRPYQRPRSRMGRCGLDASGLDWVTVARSCEHGNEPSGSIKG